MSSTFDTHTQCHSQNTSENKLRREELVVFHFPRSFQHSSLLMLSIRRVVVNRYREVNERERTLLLGQQRNKGV